MKSLMDEPLRLPPRPSRTIRPAVVLQFPTLDRLPRGGLLQMQRRKADERATEKQPALRAFWCALRHAWRQRAERQALSRQLSRLPDHLLADIGVDTEGNHHDF